MTYNPEEYIFITTEAAHNKIKNILEAIESEDTELYWKDRKAWMTLHSKNIDRRDNKLNNTKPKPICLSATQKKRFRQFRDCFGYFESGHTFCLEICNLGEHCERMTKEKAEKRKKQKEASNG